MDNMRGLVGLVESMLTKRRIVSPIYTSVVCLVILILGLPFLLHMAHGIAQAHVFHEHDLDLG